MGSVRWKALCAAGLCLVGGCLEGGSSKLGAGAVTADEAPFGPSIVFNPLAMPTPEVPFPNDLILVASDATAAGVTWNVSEEAPTDHEATLRGQLNTLDGFGTFAQITVPFDGPLDLDTVGADTVLLVNIEPGHAAEGQRAALDFGDGHFPLNATGQFWAGDPRADYPDFLLPLPNDAPYRGTTGRVTHYEVATHTLMLRPIVPLAPDARYAVLVTRGVQGRGVGTDGQVISAPVRSPFVYKAHAAQADLVGRALDLAELTPQELAFGWTFKTADVTRPLRQVRSGLYGHGPLAALADDFPATLGEIRDTGVVHDADGQAFPADPIDNIFTLQGDYLAEILGIVVGLAGNVEITFDHVDYVVFGSLPTPDIRTGPGKVQGINTDTGEGEVGVDSVPYLIAVPKATAVFQPPFDLVFYFHGTATSRFEFLAMADNLARQGIATVAYDQVGHGPIVPDIRLLLAGQGLTDDQIELILPVLVNFLAPHRQSEFAGLGFAAAFELLSEIGFFAELALIGRTEDATGDGALESGESFFFANPFKQCAAIHQDLVDFMQFVRVLRALDPGGLPTPPADPRRAPPSELTASLLAGDFNADGVLDLGGPDAHIGVAGTSLGGIHAVLTGAVEPEVRTISPIVSGGGLSDILLRSSLRQITRVIYLEIFGPLVVGCPDGEGGMWLSLNDESDRCKDASTESVARLPAVGAGARITLDNLSNGERTELVLTEDGVSFSVAVEADRWDQLLVTVERADGGASQVPIQTPFEGLALERNTPDLRRLLGIQQHVLDRCDPATFAPHIFLDPLAGHAPKHILYETALQDGTVPISTGVSLARATGVLGRTRDLWGPVMATLIAEGVLLGSDYDVDDVAGDNDPEHPGIGPLPPVPSGPDGQVSAIRFANVGGKHEYIAGQWNHTEIEDPTTYSRNRMALFHRTGGRVVEDDLCIQDNACPLLDLPLDALLER